MSNLITYIYIYYFEQQSYVEILTNIKYQLLNEDTYMMRFIIVSKKKGIIITNI